MATVGDWLRQELPKILEGTVAGEEAIEYILSMTSFDEVEDFLSELTDRPTQKTRKFVAQLRHKWLPLESARGDYTPVVQPDRPKESSKQEAPKELPIANSQPKHTSRTAPVSGSKSLHVSSSNSRRNVPKCDTNFDQKSKSRTLPLSEDVSGGDQMYQKAKFDDLAYFSKQHTSTSKSSKKQQLQHSSSTQASQSGHPPGFEKKPKFVSLNSSKGQAKASTHLPGRHICECLAQKHQLLNNCVECGRIVCEQEGAGACVTCGAFVCSPEEQALLARSSKKSTKHRNQLMKHHNVQVPTGVLLAAEQGSPLDPALLNKAVSHKDRLLEFDKTSVRRTKVTDDESDYFSSANRWQSGQERETLRQKEEELREIRHGSRLQQKKKVTLDFAGRKVIEEETLIDVYDERHVKDLSVSTSSSHYTPPTGGNSLVAMDTLVNPTISTEPPKFVQSGKNGRQKKKPRTEDVTMHPVARVQDRQLLEMRDEGKCLSMHQPWASLLVHGIKRVEGRSWYSAHRGKLWIASTVTEPSPLTVEELEEQYRQLFGDPDLEFPFEYPTGKLLGSVEVLDCLPQEDFKSQVGSEESESPFVMIVEHPLSLVTPLSVKGQHKIWQLPSDLHLKAKRSPSH